MRFGTVLKLVALVFSIIEKPTLAFCYQNGERSVGTCQNGMSVSPCEGFQFAGGNAGPSTTLWGLAEVHQKKALTIKCIEKLTENSDEHILYLEGVQAGTKVDCKSRGFKNKNGRTCMGWDNVEAQEQLLSLESIKSVIDPHITQSCITKLAIMFQDKSDEYISKELAVMKRNYLTLKGAQTKKYYAPFMLEAIELLLKGYKAGSSFTDLFKENEKMEPTQQVGIDQLKKVKELNHKRNVAHVKQLAKHPKNKLGISLFGVNHYTKHKNDQLDIYDSEYFRSELAKFEHENSFAVLAMPQL